MNDTPFLSGVSVVQDFSLIHPPGGQGWLAFDEAENGHTLPSAEVGFRLDAIEVHPVPEPASIAVLLAGTGLIASRRRKVA